MVTSSAAGAVHVVALVSQTMVIVWPVVIEEGDVNVKVYSVEDEPVALVLITVIV